MSNSDKTPEMSDVQPAAVLANDTQPVDSLMKLSLTNSKEAKPNAIIGVNVAKMSEVTAAGVHLSKYVLNILSASIFAFIIYFGVMEFFAARNIDFIYNHVLSSNKNGSDIYALSQFEKTIEDLNTISKNSASSFDEKAKKNLSDVLNIVNKARFIAPTDKKKIEECQIPLTGDALAGWVKNCIEAIEKVKQLAVQSSVSLADFQIANDYAIKIAEERQALRNFWMQAAQLILLNLLLPLLTGLFGYVFGTQQAKQEKN